MYISISSQLLRVNARSVSVIFFCYELVRLLRLTYQWVFHLSSSHSYLVNEFTEPISRDSYFGFEGAAGFVLLSFLFY